MELNFTITCFINLNINKLSLIENNYLKANKKIFEEYNINKMTAINNDRKCNCCYISSVQKVKYLGITKILILNDNIILLISLERSDNYFINSKPLVIFFHPLKSEWFS